MSFKEAFDRHINTAIRQRDFTARDLFKLKQAEFEILVKEGLLFDLPPNEATQDRVATTLAVFSQRLTQRRNSLNYTYTDLSKRTGLSMQALSKFERDVDKPLVTTVRSIANGLSTSVSYLVGETDDPELDAVSIISTEDMGIQLGRLLIEQDMSARDLAQLTGTSFSNLSRILNGTPPKFYTSVRLAAGLGLPVGSLFGERINKPQIEYEV